MSMLEKPLIAFTKRACVLLDPQPVVVKSTPKTDSPTARGASFQRITLRSWEIYLLFAISPLMRYKIRKVAEVA